MAQIGQPPSSGLPLPLLSTALRTRPGSISALAELALREPWQVRIEVEQLAELGLLRVDGETIEYPEPALALARLAERGVEEAVQQAGARLAEAQALMAALPELVRSWRSGEPEPGAPRIEVFHGPYAATDHWLALTRGRTVSRTDGCLPDLSRILEAPEEAQQVWHDAVAASGHRVRVLVPVHALEHPRALEVLSVDLAAGAQIRMLAEPPSWMWISDDAAAGIPWTWGERWPTSVVSVTSEPVVRLVRWVFDEYWRQAVPIGAEGRAPWDPLLALMAQGATLESASRALGISSRTGRRRITAAMEHFGVSGQLALGAAWERARS